MKVERHAPRKFLERTQQLVGAGAAENHWLLVLAARLEAGDMTLNAPPVLATVEDGGGPPLLAALRTPPGNLVVSSGPVEAAHALAEGLAQLKVSLPGVTGPKLSAEAFASRWTTDRELVNLTRVRSCTEILDVSSASGELRVATTDDIDTVARWVHAFQPKVFPEVADARRFAKRRIADDAVFVWDDGRPVSMACVDGDTPAAVRLDWIYTPDEHRGRGYAKSCVATITGQMLEQGRTYCLAHAITSDARANAFLERVGFVAAGVNATWRFVGA